MGNFAEALRASGDLTGAEEMHRKSLNVCEVAYGFNHPKSGTAANNLAAVYKDMGKLDEAEALYRRALAIDEASGADTSTVINNLSTILTNCLQ